ncbi:hypothetical protein CcaverHIS002_0209190 [Cutaneotrichosporon cavernicola]|nr:hypothetical protein CcaverHIS002_0209190 [Cutaneotrichosporon cavernicola]
MFRATRPLFYAAQALKETTGIVGLPVHKNPPSGAQVALYRDANRPRRSPRVERNRMAIVERAGEDISSAERELGTIVEIAIEEAKIEKHLLGQMGEWKAYVSGSRSRRSPEPNQWRYFDPTGDSL